jgi:nitrogen fixation-related uncharacterized protein
VFSQFGILKFSTLLVGPLLHFFGATTPTGASQLDNFLQSLTQIITGVGVFIAALFIAGGGIAWTMSSGNPDRMEKAKHTILYACVGLVICIAAYAIATFFGSQATQAFGS